MNMSTPWLLHKHIYTWLLHKHIYTPSVCPDSTILTWVFSWWPIMSMKVSSLKHCMIFRVHLYYVHIPLSVSLTYFRKTALPVTFCFLSIHRFRIQLCVVDTYLNSKHLRNFWQCWTGFSQLCKISIFTESTFFFKYQFHFQWHGWTVYASHCSSKAVKLKIIFSWKCSHPAVFRFCILTLHHYILYQHTFSRHTAGMLTVSATVVCSQVVVFFCLFFWVCVCECMCFRYCLIF